MRHGRWVAVAAGLAAAVALAAPAGAGVRAAASDKTILRAGVITPGDVPSTWAPAKQTDVGSRNFGGIKSCKAIVNAMNAAHRAPRALSRQFSDPSPTSNAFAQDSVNAFKDVKSATQNLAAYQASSALTCYQEAYKKATRGQGQLTLTPITDLPGVGDDRAGYEASITVTSQTGQPVHVIADIIVVRVGRAVAGFNLANNDVRIPQGPAIVNAVVARLRSALGA
jgi:hypothetical protein